MSIDRTKVLDAAQKYFAKAQYDRAIAEYRKLVQEDPRDVRIWLKIGDIYTRKGAKREACDTYFRVAEQYAEQSFFLKAVAVYKQILKLDPARIDVTSRLAEMYEQLQLASDALAAYEQVAQAHAKAGDTAKVLTTLGRMADLDPGNVGLRIKYAEALSKEGRAEDAANVFEAAASLLREQGRLDDYVKVAERLLFHRPKSVDTARDLARAYIERKDPKRALARLQVCYNTSPQDLETLELLAEAFYLLGQTPKTISVYREMARIHHEVGNQTEQASILRRILDLDPADAEAKQSLDAIAPKPPPPPNQLQADPDIVFFESDEQELLEEDLEPGSVSGPPPPPPVPAESNVGAFDSSPPPDPAAVEPLAPPPSDLSRAAQVTQLLEECDVFLRYGLRAKVIAQLHRVLELDPTHMATRLRLRDMFLEAGETDAAVEQLYALVDFLEERDPSAAADYAQQIAELTGGAPPVVIYAPPPDEAGSEARGAAPPPASAEDILAPMSPAEFDAVPLREPTSEESVPPAEPEPGEIEEVLNEVDFFLAQAMIAEALTSLEEALLEHPNQPLLTEKLTELSGPAVAAQAPDTITTRSDPTELASALAAEVDPALTEDGSGVLDVETVFAQFKKGVEETVPLEDSETHYDLGIAYKEMGLLDDAIHEFELCTTNPEKECTAHTMIGLCNVERGDLAEAVSHFKKGLYSDQKTEQEEMGLYFELGAAYELLRDPKEALYYYQKVQKRRPDFRDVAARIAALSLPQSVRPPKPDAPAEDSVDAAFDDLMRNRES